MKTKTRKWIGWAGLAWTAALFFASGAGGTERPDGNPDVLALRPFTRWRSFGLDAGLPSEKVLCIRAGGGRVWAGTEAGLAGYEEGRWRTWGVKDGLPHPVVLSLDLSPRTGDLWIGTMGGLARLSGGRIDAFTQLSSGLSNDFVNGVECDPGEDHVWAATAMGASRFNLRTGEWTIFTEQNTPMAEPWTYSVAIDRGRVYVGAWGAGILEYDQRSGRWREYRDPDKEMEIDLLPDDGPVHDVTASVDFQEGVLWQATYFGLARYDGRAWSTYFAEDCGLAGNFVQFVRARGRVAWCCTDQGLSATDGLNWATYRRREDGKGEIQFSRKKEPAGTMVTETAMAHNFILGVDFQDQAIWVATEKGVSLGEPDPEAAEAAAAPAIPRSSPDQDAPAVQVPAAAPASVQAPAPAPAPPEALPARFRYASTPEELLPYRHLKIYHEFFTAAPEFRGAGREKPEPEVEEIRIGFIGPLEDQDQPDLPPGFRSGLRNDIKAELFGRPMLRAAQLAIEEANRAGGYKGKPFRLVRRTDLVQWGQTSNELSRFAYQDSVWAILSGVDSNHQHVLARADLKAEVPIVNAGSTDPTLLEHAIPWIVRVLSDDRQNAYVLLDAIFRVRGLSRVAVLRVNDRDGRVGVAEFVQGARRLNHPIVIEQRFLNGDRDFSSQLERIAQASPDALFLFGNPQELGMIVKEARRRGLAIPIFANDRCALTKFLETAGPAAEGVVAVSPFNPEGEEPAWLEFKRLYRERFGEDPNAFSAHAYDGMNLIIAAIRSAGCNRARIRDALFSMKSFDGITGRLEFDSTSNNIRRPWLAEVRGGKFRYIRPPDRGKEK
ncbi:MAG: ABC transporter substrate-binding protein [Planctomycetes bacterium]|nr:ABC transporter substrate-binding protein [Planctomycetota bacterium]